MPLRAVLSADWAAPQFPKAPCQPLRGFHQRASLPFPSPTRKIPAMRSSNFRLLLPALLSFCLPVVAQSAQPANRIVAPIDESTRVTLPGNVHPLAQARYDRGPASLAAPTGRIALVLQRSAAQQQALTQYLVDLQSPGSPNYHKWLTPAQYGAQFGVSDSDLATVQNWPQAHGFKIEKVPQGRNLIQFSGTF